MPSNYEEVLTGPHAAALLGLDGFRERNWPLQFCCPHGRHDVPFIQTRRWKEPIDVDGARIAHPSLVLRHLGYYLTGSLDGIGASERIELAVEHARRRKLITLDDLWTRGGANPGDAALRPIIRARRGEPCTESYAETITMQTFRAWGLQVFTQVPVFDVPLQWRTADEHERLRSDFAISYERLPKRPKTFKPSEVLLLELFSAEFHGGSFVQDADKQLVYDRLGYNVVIITPNQLRDRPAEVFAAIQGAFRRVGKPWPAGEYSCWTA